MSNPRTHHVTTTDGVTIGGTVHGQGPPLVFVHGAMGDGDLDWQAVVEHLTDRFTCHLPSERGRGFSSDHDDLRFGRRADDVRAYVDSLGTTTGLVGWSAGGALALAAAARSDAVAAVAVYEPVMDRLMDEQERGALGAAVTRMGELTAAGDLTAAVRAFASFVCRDEEVARLDAAGYLEAAGRYAPTMLRAFRRLAEHEGPHAPDRPGPADPAVLGAIWVPLLVLHGAETKPFWPRFARHVAEHAADARTQEIPGAGHAAPLTHPEALAEALTGLFASEQPPG